MPASTDVPPSLAICISPLPPFQPDLYERAWCSVPHPTLPLIATAHSKSVTIYSLSSLSSHSSLSGGHTRSVRSVAWKPNLPPQQLCLVTGSFDSTAGLWRWDGELPFSGHDTASDSLEIDLNSSQRVNSNGNSDDDGDKDWEFTLVLEGHDSEIKGVSFAPSGAYLATCSRDQTVWIWEDVGASEGDDEWETVAVLNEHNGDMKGIAWCPDVPGRNSRRRYSADVLASASYDNTVRIWREDGDGEWVCVAVLEGHDGTVWGVQWEQKPRADNGFPRLMTYSADQTIRLWSLQEEDEEGGASVGSGFRPALGGIPNTMRRSLREEWVCDAILPKAHTRDIYSVTWSADTGLMASTGSDGVIAVYREYDDTRVGMGNDDEEAPEKASERPGQSGRWRVEATVPNAHGPYEINHITWCKRYDAGSERKGTEEMLVTTGDEGMAALVQFFSFLPTYLGVLGNNIQSTLPRIWILPSASIQNLDLGPTLRYLKNVPGCNAPHSTAPASTLQPSPPSFAPNTTVSRPSTTFTLHPRRLTEYYYPPFSYDQTTPFSSLMAGPTSPGTEGPTFAPPHLPAGWIAQWDGSSKKYYFVQLSTGVSQWEVPTDAAPTGATPAQPSDHPYGVPQPELITHPDGSQTVRHADGTLEPVNPPMPPDNTNTRGLDGPTGDRGLGSMAMNALLGKNSSHNNSSGSHGNSSSPLGGLASQLISGIGGHGNNNANTSSGGKSSLGKLGGALASSFLNKPQQQQQQQQGQQGHQGQQQNYHGSQSTGHQQQHGGLAGSLMGGVANMFGGNKPAHGSNDYGYSNSASGGGGYSGQAPPTSYQPSGSTHTQHSSPPAGASSYHSPASNQGHNQQSYPPPPTQAQNHNQSFPPPPNQYSTPNQGQTHHNTAYGAPPQQSHNQYPPPPSGGPPSSYGQQHSYAAQSNQQQQQQYSGYNPATYGGGTPQGSQPGGYPSQPSYAGNSSQQGGYNTHY